MAKNLTLLTKYKHKKFVIVQEMAVAKAAPSIPKLGTKVIFNNKFNTVPDKTEILNNFSRFVIARI